ELQHPFGHDDIHPTGCVILLRKKCADRAKAALLGVIEHRRKDKSIDMTYFSDDRLCGHLYFDYAVSPATDWLQNRTNYFKRRRLPTIRPFGRSGRGVLVVAAADAEAVEVGRQDDLGGGRHDAEVGQGFSTTTH